MGVYLRQILSMTGVILQKIDTKIINLAPLFSLIIKKLLKNEFRVNSFVYKVNVPNTILNIPKYWVSKSFSFKNNKENKELNRGVSESRGIVKLKSEWRIDFKKKIAEITLITISITPGKI